MSIPQRIVRIVDTYPDTALTDAELADLQRAGALIQDGLREKENPAQLRLILVELQALRWTIGNKMVRAKGHKRDAFRGAYNLNKNKKMSPNAAYKEAEADEVVIRWKNTSDILETAYDVMQNFVNTNQTSVRLAAEESKNNL
jgi:hypothetical protein